MLCITYKQGEAIVLDSSIVIRILEVGNGRVKIGIDADPSIIIVREELLDPAYIATHPAPERGRNA